MSQSEEAGLSMHDELPIFGYTVNGDDPVVVVIRGELDVSTAPQVSAALEEAILSGHRNVVLDLGEVAFIDSSALHVLHKASSTLHEIGGHVKVSSASDRVRRVFELSGFDAVLPLPARLEVEPS